MDDPRDHLGHNIRITTDFGTDGETTAIFCAECDVQLSTRPPMYTTPMVPVLRMLPKDVAHSPHLASVLHGMEFEAVRADTGPRIVNQVRAIHHQEREQGKLHTGDCPMTNDRAASRTMCTCEGDENNGAVRMFPEGTG